MTQESEFERLEQFVEKLLKKFDQLREEKTQLERRLQSKETEVNDLKNELTSADTARGDISSRVKSLIEQIEEWEMGLADSVGEEMSQDQTEVEPVATGETDEEPVAEEIDEDENDGGVQQNLFNVEPQKTQVGG